MSDSYRAPPTGPRSSRDYESTRPTSSHKHANNGQSQDNYASRDFRDSYKQREYQDSYKGRDSRDSYKRDRDTYTPGDSNKRDSRDNYHPSGRGNFQGRGGFRPRGDTYKPKPDGPGIRESKDDGAPSSGSKRPAPPSEPSGYRKRTNFGEHPESQSSYRGRMPKGPAGPSGLPSTRGGRSRRGERREIYPGGDSRRGGRTERGRGRGDFTSSARGGSSMRGSFSTRASSRRERGRGSFSGRGNYKNATGPITNTDTDTPMAEAGPVTLEKSLIFSVKVSKPSEVYKRVQQVGEGTYGKVYKAKNIITEENVALKKLRLESEREGFPITAIREIKLLQSFDHENIVGLLEMMVEHNQIYMVFDYMDHDLTGLLTHPDLRLEESHRKFIFKQLMEGLNYLHKKRVIHRDIKGSNILVDSTGNLKIADFGLARTMKVVKETESPDYTNRVITIWYRPPELLLGATDYGREVDVWGVGCLLIELYSKVAAFQGFDEVGQLSKIFNIMGTPSNEQWPGIDNLPWFEMLKPRVNIASKFKELYQSVLTPHSFDLAEKLLALNPAARLTAEEALEHPYFIEDPQPAPLEFLKEIKGEWHEFETKKRRRKERKRIQDEAKLKQQNEAMQENKHSEQEQTGDISMQAEDIQNVIAQLNGDTPNPV